MESSKMTRRQFLKTSAIVLGATVVSCSGLTAAGLYTQPIELPTETGTGNMNEKILIAYSSACGSTAEVAQEIAKVLTGKGQSVDVMQYKDVKDPAIYKSVILGSAIRMSKWRTDAADFVKKYQSVLSQKSVAYFTVCLTLKDDNADTRKEVQAYTEAQRALVKPAKEAFFAGKMDYKRLNFFEGMLMKNMIKAPEGDYRKWDLIRAWAAELS